MSTVWQEHCSEFFADFSDKFESALYLKSASISPVVSKSVEFTVESLGSQNLYLSDLYAAKSSLKSAQDFVNLLVKTRLFENKQWNSNAIMKIICKKKFLVN